MPIAFTIVFDIFPIEKEENDWIIRGRIWFFKCIRAFIRCVYNRKYKLALDFYVNIPIGLMSLIFILKAYKENNPPTKQNIDWWGR